MFRKKQFQPIIFIALMGSSALALASWSLFSKTLVSYLVYIFSFVIVFIFLWHYVLFLKHLFHKDNFKRMLKNPTKANLYSAMPIASALIVMIFVSVFSSLCPEISKYLAFIFWLNSLLFSLLFIILVPINLKFRSKLEYIAGTWFLPPVGLFVLISAGVSVATIFPVLRETIIILNMFIFGPAFILYFLTLNLLYFKSKVQENIFIKEIPTFHIVLAPVAVSILALLSMSKLMLIDNTFGLANIFFSFSKIYSLIMFGYGLWLIMGLLFLYNRIMKEKGKIPFSELWWAFIFPTGAFVLMTIKMFQVFNLGLFQWIYYVIYTVFLILWLYVFIKFIKNNNN